uniref:Uncharacterized protein n=1 Tax=Dulem virus 120 TaxID=3145597 RepID=A0AAU8BAL6_9VIRU
MMCHNDRVFEALIKYSVYLQSLFLPKDMLDEFDAILSLMYDFIQKKNYYVKFGKVLSNEKKDD